MLRGAGRRAYVLDDLAGDRRREQGVAGGHDPHGVHQLLGRGVLEQEPAGPGAERLEDVVVALEGGEDDDPAWDVGFSDDAAGGLQAVHPRHLDVHEHHIGSQSAGRPRRPGSPSLASPTTSMSSSASRIIRNPARTIAWSSTSTTLIVMPRPRSAERWRARRTRLGSGAGTEVAAVQGRPLAHPDQPVAALAARPAARAGRRRRRAPRSRASRARSGPGRWRWRLRSACGCW